MDEEREWFIILVDHANLFHNLKRLSLRFNYKQLVNILVPYQRGIVGFKVIYLGKYKRIGRFIAYLESQDWIVDTLSIHKTKGKIELENIDYQHWLEFIEKSICDNVILVSGNGDFAELVKNIRKLDKQVEIWSFRRSLAHQLIKAAGEENIHYLDDILDRLKYK